jgi:hypothetical protein
MRGAFVEVEKAPHCAAGKSETESCGGSIIVKDGIEAPSMLEPLVQKKKKKRSFWVH